MLRETHFTPYVVSETNPLSFKPDIKITIPTTTSGLAKKDENISFKMISVFYFIEILVMTILFGYKMLVKYYVEAFMNKSMCDTDRRYSCCI